MLGRNIVLYGELELLLTKGRPSNALDFVVGESSREEISQDVVIVVAKLLFGSVVTDESGK